MYKRQVQGTTVKDPALWPKENRLRFNLDDTGGLPLRYAPAGKPINFTLPTTEGGVGEVTYRNRYGVFSHNGDTVFHAGLNPGVYTIKRTARDEEAATYTLKYTVIVLPDEHTILPAQLQKHPNTCLLYTSPSPRD